MTHKRYETPAAFRRALEDRLKARSREQGTDLQRLRRSVAFDRLLCRLFSSPDGQWVLKGGYAMELRIQTARATKDIDLSLPPGSVRAGTTNQNALLQEMLQDALDTDLGDYLTFLVGAAMLDLDAAPYGGARFPVTSSMAGKPFVKFHLDLGVGDAADEPFETFTGTDWLAFAGIPRGEFRGLSREGQFAEKLHAYTRPREGRENSRVKDLVDMILLIDLGLDLSRQAHAINRTFHRRGSHPLPLQLEAPPEFWSGSYPSLAQECGLPEEIMSGFIKVSDFLGSLVMESEP
jgi:hypothetical protein